MAEYRIISADSHLQIAPERWTARIPAKYQDHAPRTVRMPDGANAIVIEGKPSYGQGNLTGRPYENRWPLDRNLDTKPGGGSPEQRLQEQDVDGVDGEVLFSHAGGAAYYHGIQEKDPEAYKATVRAWNEFLAEEYCAVARERLIGLGLVPCTGVDDAIQEMDYCARMGLKGMFMSRFPNGTDTPHPEDDRFWAASLDLNMPLTAHISLCARPNLYPFPYERDPKEVASGVDVFGKLSHFALKGAGNALQMIFTGVFDRFPRLRFYFAENHIGWIPHFLESVDDQYDRYIPWAEPLLGMKKLSRRPSEYVREHISWGFMRNPVGIRGRYEIGVTQMMWATDFPHPECDWPESLDVIEENFAGVSEEERQLMVGGNAINYFHLDPTPPVRRESPKAAAPAGG